MVLGNYNGNKVDASSGSTIELENKYGGNFSLKNVLQVFHTHPNGQLGATQSAPNLSSDVTNLQTDKQFMPNASFIVLYRMTSQGKPEEYDYTHEFIPPKK
jgi:hypothetical protein